eukprot:8485946-Alexandrium_andersonii.AAC.1
MVLVPRRRAEYARIRLTSDPGGASNVSRARRMALATACRLSAVASASRRVTGNSGPSVQVHFST